MTKSCINFVATSQINQSHNVYPNTGVINTITGNTNNGQNIKPTLLQQLMLSQFAQQRPHMLTSQISPSPTIAHTRGQLVNNTQMIHAAAAYLQNKQQQQYNYLLSPQFQPMVGTPLGTQPSLLLQQQQQLAASQANMIPLGSMPNPITIDDNMMDVDPPVININQRLDHPPVIQVQKKDVNLNRQSLSQNTKK